MKYILPFIFMLSFVYADSSIAQSFSFTPVGPTYVMVNPPNDTQLVQIKGIVRNTGSVPVRFRFIKYELLPVNWGAQICYDLCYHPTVDTIPQENIFGDSLYTIQPGHVDTNFYVDFLVYQQGYGRVVIKMQNGENLNQFELDTFHVESGNVGITPISGEVKDYSLSQNYPNPFNPSTSIQFSIPKPEAVTIRVYDALGREVVSLLNNERLNAGTYKYNFNVIDKNMSSGMYFYTLTAGSFKQTMKMMLIK